MASRGARAEYQEASSHTERWRAREVEDSSSHLRRPYEDYRERHRIVDVEVMRIWTWMAKDLMGTDTSRMD